MIRLQNYNEMGSWWKISYFTGFKVICIAYTVGNHLYDIFVHYSQMATADII